MRIYIEGLDRTGKTTLKKELSKETNYEHVILDRGPISNIAYDYLFGRKTPEDNLEYEAKESFLNPLIIILYASEEEIFRRMKSTKTEAFEYAEKITEFRNILWIDTTNISIEEEIKIIKDYIEKIKNENRRLN